jgi:glycerol-1-phosphate dehydrogenase [NAD(P)+]
VKENTPNIMGEIKGQDLVDNADEICNIIDGIPNPDELTALIDSVHGKKLLTDIGLDKSYQGRTARLSPYVRKRLTFMRLLKFYDFYEEVLAIK